MAARSRLLYPIGVFVTSTRREMRELALIALYQIDVGKHSIDEIIEGSLEQVRLPIASTVGQWVGEMSREMRLLIAERAPKAVSAEPRRIRKFAREAVEKMRDLSSACAQILCDVIARRPSIDPETAIERITLQA